MSTRNAPILIALAAISFVAWYFSRQSNSLRPDTLNADTLIIGTNAAHAPFTFIENDKIVGFDIDVAQEVAKRLNKKTTIKDIPFSALIPEVVKGKIHIIAAGLTPTDKRSQRVLFTAPYFQEDQFVVVQPLHRKKIDGPDDLIGKSVLVDQGYTTDHYISKIEGIDITRIPSGTMSTALQVLQNGKADAYITTASTLQPYIEKHGSHVLQFTPLSDSSDSIALAVAKKNPKLHQEMQAILDDMHKDGTIKSLRNKWKI